MEDGKKVQGKRLLQRYDGKTARKHAQKVQSLQNRAQLY